MDMPIIDYALPRDVDSRSFRLTVNGQSVTVTETPPMDAAERQRLAEEYRKLPDYCHIYDTAGMHLHYAHVGVGGDVALAIEIDETIHSFRVHPLRRGIAASACGRVLTFRSGCVEPRYLIVRLNELPPLFIILDSPETDIPRSGDAAVIDGAAYLTDDTGRIDQTECFRRVFEAASGSGKTLLVPGGIYAITQLHLQRLRNFRVYFARGCLLKVKPSAHGENEHRHGLWLEDCEDVTISGRGCIDHQAYEHYVLGGNQYQHGMVNYYTSNELCPWITQSPLFITGSRRIRVEGITIRNGRNFNVNCRNCDDLELRYLKILTPPACTPEYADGINTGSCRRVRIENCLVASNDDCFASGHYFSTHDSRSSEDHMIRGLVGWTLRGSGARLGFYANQNQGDFTFEDCDFAGMSYTSFLVHALQPDSAGVPHHYGTIRVRRCGFDDGSRLQSLVSVENAAIDNLEFVDLAFHGEPAVRTASRIEGDSLRQIPSLLLDNVTVNGRRITLLSELAATVSGVARVQIR